LVYFKTVAFFCRVWNGSALQLLFFFSFSFFIFYNEPYFDIADFGAIYYEFKLEKLT